jgi:hypothetical protein
MHVPRRAVIGGLAIVVPCAGVASILLSRRVAEPPRLAAPKPPGPPIFAGNLTAGGRLLHSVKPNYPPALRYLGYQRVLLRCVIAEEGTVEKITYVSGPSELLPYAMAAVAQWRYQPVRLYNPCVGKSRAISVATEIEVPLHGPWP